jgi:glucokinase
LDAAARSGEQHAIEILDGVGEMLGVALCSALATLGLRVVVIGGGMSQSDVIIDATRRTLQERAIPTIAANVVVRRARFVQETGLVGAAMLTAPYQETL